MKISDREITTNELEKMFYTGNPDDLEKIKDALQEEFDLVEEGDAIQMSYLADNLEAAKELLEKRTGVFGVLVRALEMADAALDQYDAVFFEELRLEDEKRVTEANKNIKDPKKEEVAKRLTDTVLKAKATAKVSQYRRFRNYLNGYVRGLEKSLTAIGIIVNACDHEAARAHRANYRPNSDQTSTEPESGA